jgi:hypothetical protein
MSLRRYTDMQVGGQKEQEKWIGTWQAEDSRRD